MRSNGLWHISLFACRSINENSIYLKIQVAILQRADSEVMTTPDLQPTLLFR